jgi:hypothetical protein
VVRSNWLPGLQRNPRTRGFVVTLLSRINPELSEGHMPGNACRVCPRGAAPRGPRRGCHGAVGDRRRIDRARLPLSRTDLLHCDLSVASFVTQPPLVPSPSLATCLSPSGACGSRSTHLHRAPDLSLCVHSLGSLGGLLKHPAAADRLWRRGRGNRRRSNHLTNPRT